MVLLNEGLNRIRTIVASDLSKGQVGTGSALPTPSDTGLQSATAVSLLDLASVTANSDKTINVQYTLPSTIANGATLHEFEVQASTGDSVLRKVHESIVKDNTKEVRYFTSIFVAQRK